MTYKHRPGFRASFALFALALLARSHGLLVASPISRRAGKASQLALRPTSSSPNDGEGCQPQPDARRTRLVHNAWFSSLVVASTLFFASPASAATTKSVFTNDYSDPFHPKCERHIVVSSDGKTFHYSGTAVGLKDDPVRRGCTPAEIKEFGLRKGAFDGEIFGDGTKISAGDGIHEGVWEPANTAGTNLGYENVDGIRWNDGNKWVVKEKMSTKIGEGVFYAYIGFSALAGVKGVLDAVNRKKEEAN